VTSSSSTRGDAPAVASAGLTDRQAELLLTAAQGDGTIYSGGPKSSSNSRVARTLAAAGLVRFIEAQDAGWARGMWAAVIHCEGMNALWRHHDDRHIEGCAAGRCTDGRWSSDGTCTGCRDLRRLDDLAWDARLETLTETARSVELHTCLWCPEHGYMRASQITTIKVCRLPGSTFHDGGLNRLWWD